MREKQFVLRKYFDFLLHEFEHLTNSWVLKFLIEFKLNSNFDIELLSLNFELDAWRLLFIIRTSFHVSFLLNC